MAAGSLLLVSLPLAARPEPGSGGQEVREIGERASRWLARRVETALASERDETFPLALAVAALASRAASGDADGAGAGGVDRPGELAALVRAGRARLRREQASDGGFGTGDARQHATWQGVAALRGARAAEDVAARERARDYLRRSAPGADPTAAPGAGDAASADADVAAALEYLRTTGVRAAAPESGAWLEVYALAGGRFDARAARRLLGEGSGSLGNGICAALGLPGAAGAIRDLHVAVRVLAHYGSPRLGTRAGGTLFWPRAVQRELVTLWRPDDGAFAARRGGAPDVVATAEGLLVLDVIEPWLGVPEATLDALEAAEPQHYADLSGDCEVCHQALQPGLDHQWRKSAHAREDVGCADCHGDNHSRIFREEGRVSAAVCGECHVREAHEFASSGHSRAMSNLTGSALFAATPSGLRDACIGCHATGYEHTDGSIGSCNHCHTGHEFSASQAREPEACILCHTGADYPIDRAYELSKHGLLYRSTGDTRIGPTCVTCHMPGGSHADGLGITIGSVGVGGALAGSEPPIPMPLVSREVFRTERARMVRVCTECHSSRFSEDSLARADAVKRAGDEFLREARAILEELHAAGKVGRPGEELHLGGEQVPVGPEVPGAAALNRFYTMWRFHYAATWKGAYHGSHSISNLSSEPGLSEDLDFLRGEAERLMR